MMRMAMLIATCLLASCGTPAPGNESAAVGRDPAIAASSPDLPGNDASPVAAASSPIPAPSPVAAPSAAATGACTVEIGDAAARTLVQQCLAASPATHSPCNAANSCTMIRDEITRGCDLFDAADPGRPSFCGSAASVGAQAAATTVRKYYDAIRNRDFAHAYSMWRDEGRASGKSLAGFAAGFAHTKTTAVVPGKPGEPEGAAGSSYVTVPVTVTATTDTGIVQHFTGSYVLRRTNDVPGSSAADRRWGIQSAALKPVR